MSKKIITNRSLTQNLQGPRINIDTLNRPKPGDLAKAEDIDANLVAIIAAINFNASNSKWDYDAQGNKIINVQTPTAPSDAATKGYADSLVKDDWDYDARGNKITNLGEPIADNDAATKKYARENGLPPELEKRFGYNNDALKISNDKYDNTKANVYIEDSKVSINPTGGQTVDYVFSKQEATFNKPLNMVNSKITNVDTPTNDKDAATKEYVDEQLLPATGKQQIKDIYEIEASLTGTQSIADMLRDGSPNQHTQNGTNIDKFTVNGIEYETDAIKVKLYNIVSYAYPTATNNQIYEFTFPIADIQTSGIFYQSFNIKFRSATGNYYFGEQGFTIIRNSSDEIVIKTVPYSTTDSSNTHIKSMDVDYTQIKYVGNIGIKGDQGADGIGIKGDKGDQGIQGPKGNDSTVPGPTGPKGDKGDDGKDLIGTGEQSIKTITEEVDNQLVVSKASGTLGTLGWTEVEMCDYTALETFTKGSKTYTTDRIKMVFYNITSNKHSGTNSTEAKALVYHNINDIPLHAIANENEVLHEVSLPDRNGNVGAFNVKIRYTIYRKNNKFYVRFFNSEASGSGARLQTLDISLFAIKQTGVFGVEGPTGPKGDKGDPGSGVISPTLDKKLEATGNDIIIFGVDKADRTNGAFAKLDHQEVSLGVNNASVITILDNSTNKSTTIDSNLQLNDNKIGGVADGTAQTDAINLQQLNVEKAKIDANTTNIAGNTTDIDLNNTEIGTNATAIDTNKNNIGTNTTNISNQNIRILANATKLSNIDDDGNVENTTYDPDTNPNQFATKKMVKDNSGGGTLPPELDKRINYGTNNRTILTTDKADATAPNILLDKNTNKITTTIGSTLISDLFNNRIDYYQNLNMLGNDIENVSTIGSTDAMTISSDDSINITSGTSLIITTTSNNSLVVNNDINMGYNGSSKITGLANPTSYQDAANKYYVDIPKVFPRQSFETDDTLGTADNVDQPITGFTEHNLDTKTLNMFDKSGDKFTISPTLVNIIQHTTNGLNIKFVMKTGGFIAPAQPQYLKIKYTNSGGTTEKEFAAVWSNTSTGSYLGSINEIPYEVVYHFDKTITATDTIEFFGKAKDVSRANFAPPFKLSIEGEWT